ncbi:hypothetical protein M427DRAFT_137193 [Gonapodya prolifera JEL478]|uniref:Uncharacterized protein n=1 Tax=Gonapodya prolifera (strain JEL478) TaxID=1344416 RepID=A0A139A6N9_GONPJ|nr:hypothetical protein M427DRAFT_137193 [Gonapodya prolifera JEL478]|eukprot:KXS12482.1 hypothetical protein M427DRAFT_137193 [Gonapodya prolifera JEL478]
MDHMGAVSASNGSKSAVRQQGGIEKALLLLEESKIDLSVLQGNGSRSNVSTQDRKQRGFQTTVFAINEIVQKKLYKSKANSLEGYFRTQWKMSRAQVYRFMDSAYVLNNLDGFEDLPARERICRALKKLTKTRQELRLLWHRVLDRHSGMMMDQLNSTSVMTAYKDLEASGAIERAGELPDVATAAADGDGDGDDLDGGAGDTPVEAADAEHCRDESTGTDTTPPSTFADGPSTSPNNNDQGVGNTIGDFMDTHHGQFSTEDFDAMMTHFTSPIKMESPPNENSPAAFPGETLLHTPSPPATIMGHAAPPTSQGASSNLFSHFQSAAAEAWQTSAIARGRLGSDQTLGNEEDVHSSGGGGASQGPFSGLGINPRAVQGTTQTQPTLSSFQPYLDSTASVAPNPLLVSATASKPKSALKRKQSDSSVGLSAALAQLEAQARDGALAGVPAYSQNAPNAGLRAQGGGGQQQPGRSRAPLQRPPPLPPTLQGGAQPPSMGGAMPGQQSAHPRPGIPNVYGAMMATSAHNGGSGAPPSGTPQDPTTPFNEPPTPIWRWTPPSSAYFSPDNHLIDTQGLSDGTAADDHEVPSADFSMLTSLLHHLYARGYALFSKVDGVWRGDALEWKVAPWDGREGRADEGRRRGEVALTEPPKEVIGATSNGPARPPQQRGPGAPGPPKTAQKSGGGNPTTSTQGNQQMGTMQNNQLPVNHPAVVALSKSKSAQKGITTPSPLRQEVGTRGKALPESMPVAAPGQSLKRSRSHVEPLMEPSEFTEGGGSLQSSLSAYGQHLGVGEADSGNRPSKAPRPNLSTRSPVSPNNSPNASVHRSFSFPKGLSNSGDSNMNAGSFPLPPALSSVMQSISQSLGQSGNAPFSSGMMMQGDGHYHPSNHDLLELPSQVGPQDLGGAGFNESLGPDGPSPWMEGVDIAIPHSTSADMNTFGAPQQFPNGTQQNSNFTMLGKSLGGAAGVRRGSVKGSEISNYRASSFVNPVQMSGLGPAVGITHAASRKRRASAPGIVELLPDQQQSLFTIPQDFINPQALGQSSTMASMNMNPAFASSPATVGGQVVRQQVAARKRANSFAAPQVFSFLDSPPLNTSLSGSLQVNSATLALQSVLAQGKDTLAQRNSSPGPIYQFPPGTNARNNAPSPGSSGVLPLSGGAPNANVRRGRNTPTSPHPQGLIGQQPLSQPSPPGSRTAATPPGTASTPPQQRSRRYTIHSEPQIQLTDQINTVLQQVTTQGNTPPLSSQDDSPQSASATTPTTMGAGFTHGGATRFLSGGNVNSGTLSNADLAAFLAHTGATGAELLSTPEEAHVPNMNGYGGVGPMLNSGHPQQPYNPSLQYPTHKQQNAQFRPNVSSGLDSTLSGSAPSLHSPFAMNQAMFGSTMLSQLGQHDLPSQQGSQTIFGDFGVESAGLLSSFGNMDSGSNDISKYLHLEGAGHDFSGFLNDVGSGATGMDFHN